MKVIQHPGPLTRLRNANVAKLEERLAQLVERHAAEPAAELARWVVIDLDTSEALAITPTDATRVPLWLATRFATRPQQAAHAHGKAVKLSSMYVYWERRLRAQLDELQGPAIASDVADIERAKLPEPQAIAAARIAAGLTQEQAAQLVHLSSRKRWYEYESGAKPIDAARWELFTIKVAALKGPQ